MTRFPQAAFEAPIRSPLVMWHVLSLDAPTVAVVWTSFIGTLTETPSSLSLLLAMTFAVWILYAGDRLMDTLGTAAGRQPMSGDLALRHHFHSRHCVLFLVAILCAAGMLTILLPSIPKAALRLYMIEGAFVAGYFGLVHGRPGGSSSRHAEGFSRLPKELLVGPFFAAASFIPAASQHPEWLWRLLPDALLFTGLCCLNCLYIYAWEHRTMNGASWLTAQALPRLQGIGLVFAIASFCMFFGFPFRPVFLRFSALACGLSASALMTLHPLRHRFAAASLRSAADLALLSPLVVRPFLHVR